MKETIIEKLESLPKEIKEIRQVEVSNGNST